MDHLVAQKLSEWLKAIADIPDMHARWLNTLSYLENCGARKIASCEHPTQVRSEMLKHAAEEFRHAYHLKRQISKTGIHILEDYSRDQILGGFHALRYLDRIDSAICRLLKKQYKIQGTAIKATAYLLVTYAIEVRASSLYPLYQEVLSAKKSSISMRAIILEEEHHLEEISAALNAYPHNERMKKEASQIESALFMTLMEKLCV